MARNKHAQANKGTNNCGTHYKSRFTTGTCNGHIALEKQV